MWMVLTALVIVAADGIAAGLTGRLVVLSFGIGPAAAVLTAGFAVARRVDREESGHSKPGGTR